MGASQFARSYRNFGCTRYACCNRLKAANCPKGYQNTFVRGNPCDRYTCCRAPNCPRGTYPKRTAAKSTCPVYTCARLQVATQKPVAKPLPRPTIAVDPPILIPTLVPPKPSCGPVAMPDCFGNNIILHKFFVDGCPH